MDKEERDLYVKFVKYYARYDREDLLILRQKFINRWDLLEESAQNLLREEFKLELRAIDSLTQRYFTTRDGKGSGG